jgi:hypothetical protein
MKSICVFCGSSTGHNPIYLEAAKGLGKLLAKHGITLVYGGGNAGTMGAIANAVLENKGQVIGIIPESMIEKEWAHTGVSKLHVVKSMHERKAMMAELSDGFIALPGGFGTFEEICEVITWSQLGFLSKPVAILNVNDFYAPIMNLFLHSFKEGFIQEEHLDHIIISENMENLLQLMEEYKPFVIPKDWKRSKEEV